MNRNPLTKLARSRWIRGGVAAAALTLLPGVGLVSAPSAAAGEISWQISVGSDGYRGASATYSNGHGQYVTAQHHTGYATADYGSAGGYYQSVWRPAVYDTRYDGWGRAYRVCVRAGYYDKVWVATPAPRQPRQSYGHSRSYNYDYGSGQSWGHHYKKSSHRGWWNRGCGSSRRGHH